MFWIYFRLLSGPLAFVAAMLAGATGALGQDSAEDMLERDVVAFGQSWRLWKGQSHPSPGTMDWTSGEWNDLAWEIAELPVHYGENITGGTEIGDMRYNYSTLFLRHSFDVDALEDIRELIIETRIDDGVIIWLNGRELYRYNAPAGDPDHTASAPSTGEPVRTREFVRADQSGLRAGKNQLAAMAFNTTLTSSDIVFDIRVVALMVDRTAPVVESVSPASGAAVDSLDRVEVTFSEAVYGVEPGDLLVNGMEAGSVIPDNSGAAYTFIFDPQPPGMIEFSLSGDAAIRDASDNFLDTSGPDATWRVLVLDPLAPRIESIQPHPGAAVPTLGRILLSFSIPVRNLSPDDFRLDGSGTVVVAGPADDTGTRFELVIEGAQPGSIRISLSDDHDIVDAATGSRKLEAEAWVHRVEPQTAADAATIRINEISAAPDTAIPDEDSSPTDWVEIHNSGLKSVSLLGWGLSDNSDNLFEWIFPDVNIGPGEFMVIHASGKDRAVAGRPLHTGFRLNREGEFLALTPPGLPPSPVSQWNPSYPRQSPGLTYGVHPDGGLSYFSNPTPAATNGNSVRIRGFLDAPVISGSSGLVNQLSVPVDIEIADPEAVIRYTLDGSEPTSNNGEIYSDPIEVRGRPARPGTVIRARAFREEFMASPESVRTLIFADSVLSQSSTPEGYPSQWGSRTTTSGDYQMDPAITGSGPMRSEALEALSQIPVLTIAMDPEDLLGPTRGIYANAGSSGPAWERPAHMEWIEPDGRSAASAFCGIRVQGGSSTQNWKSKKLSLRLLFKSDYGPERLIAGLFPQSPVTNFNTIVLDAHLNLVFIHPDHNQRRRSQYIRDAYMSDLMLHTGHAGTHSRFCHLFLNGLYWGLYDIHERPDNAFASSYFGGSDDHYDTLKHSASGVVDGSSDDWNAVLSRARKSDFTGEDREWFSRTVDLTNLADYMLVNFYAGNDDWPRHNWYINASLDQNVPFHFISWDAEHVLKSVTTNNTGVANNGSPAELFHNLLRLPHFRQILTDRIQLHFGPGGIFSPEVVVGADADPAYPWPRNRAAELYLSRYRGIHGSLLLESARWGDVHNNQDRPGQPYERDIEVRNELEWLMESWFPRRTAEVLAQFRTLGWIPDLEAPELIPLPGAYPVDTLIQSRAGNGNVYYTTNGTDPMSEDGSIAPDAIFGTVNVRLQDYVHILARSYSGGRWSALTSGIYHNAAIHPPVRITEIHYNPDGNGPFPEFLELINIGESPVDIGGTVFKGLDLSLPRGTLLQPGIPALLLPMDEIFAEPGLEAMVMARYEGRLDNGGESLRLTDFLNRTIAAADYDDGPPWLQQADGDGMSLQLRNALAPGFSGDESDWVAAPPTPGELYFPVSIRHAGSASDGQELVFQLENPAGLVIVLMSSTNLKTWTAAAFQQNAAEDMEFRIPTASLASPSFFRLEVVSP